MSKVLIKDFYRTWIIFWSYYVMSLSSSLSSSVCRHNGLYSITFILIYRSFWNFNTKIHITVKKLRLIWGIVVCFQTRSSKGPKRVFFCIWIVYCSSVFDEVSSNELLKKIIKKKYMHSVVLLLLHFSPKYIYRYSSCLWVIHNLQMIEQFFTALIYIRLIS